MPISPPVREAWEANNKVNSNLLNHLTQDMMHARTPGVPHTGADALLLHMIVHDSHHRGQLLLALKTNGFDLPPEEAMWLPWRNEPWP